jgi:predicted site-specific integrase-resolvase
MSEGFDEILALKDVAQIMKVHPQTLRRWIQAGRFPEGMNFTKQKRYRWTRKQIVDFLAQTNKEIPHD